MNLTTLSLHFSFPKRCWAIVEQPHQYYYRLRYDPSLQRFVETDIPSVMHAIGFRGSYGWIAGLGTPPGRHCDTIILVERPTEVGELIETTTCAMFQRPDGDHKVILVDLAKAKGLIPRGVGDLNGIDRELLDALCTKRFPAGKYLGRDETMRYLCAFEAGDRNMGRRQSAT
jgi:hypothetical protein